MWLRSDPTRGRGINARYWFIDAYSQIGAINEMARRLRMKPELLDADE